MQSVSQNQIFENSTLIKKENCFLRGNHEYISDEQHGDFVCIHCGLVQPEKMFINDPSNLFYSSIPECAKSIQYGLPINPAFADISLSTMIDQNTPMSLNLKRAIVWDKRYIWKQRNNLHAFIEIKRIAELLNIPYHVRDYSFMLYRKVFSKGLLKGRIIKDMVAACIYSACRMEKVSRSISEIMPYLDSDYKKIIHSYIIIRKELQLKIPSLDHDSILSTFIQKLNLTNQIEDYTRFLIKRYFRSLAAFGKNPKGIIAAAILYAITKFNGQINFYTIAETLGVSKVTLRRRFRELKAFVNKKDSVLSKNPENLSKKWKVIKND